ncbi:hypothetical protein KSP40_PGU004338 [Platanthera guangdongensis]|uniref:Uncharacterized protein n=1 Tax=Platanthera guangdongensis TaxID=2320717 RepID=A0ABR2MYV2_9ASPA
MKEKKKKKKIITVLLRKCTSIPTRLKRSSSYATLSRSKSAKEEETLLWTGDDVDASSVGVAVVVVFVGSSRRRCMVKAEHLRHPVISALMEPASEERISIVKCEVVLFHHLIWMLENNGDLEPAAGGSPEELAALYAYS